MSRTNLENLKQAVKLSEYLDEETLTKEDFLKAFNTVLDIVKEIKRTVENAIENQEKTHDDRHQELTMGHSKSLEEIRGQVDHVFVGDRVKKMEEKMADMESMHKKMMAKMEDKMTKVKDGYTPKKGKDYFDGKNADPKQIVSELKTFFQEQFDELKEELLELLEDRNKKFGSRIIMTGQSTQNFTILTATGAINDANVTFTFAVKPTIININGAMYREDHGWAWSGSDTATLDAPVGQNGEIYGLQ